MTSTMLQYALGLQQAGQFLEAEAIYSEVLRSDPRNIEALYSLAMLYLHLAKFAESERLFAEVTRLDPRFGDALLHRGFALRQLRRYPESVACLDALLSASPDLIPAWRERGAALFGLEQYQEALECYDKVLAFEGGSPEAWHMRGEALVGLGRLADAVDSYDRALAINPAAINTMHKRADALFYLGQYQAANDQYERILALDPDAPFVRGRFVFDKLHRCEWSKLAEHEAQIETQLQAGKRVVTPGEYMSFSHSPQNQHQCARIWTASQSPPASPLWRGERYEHQRIRVAYLSKDFRFHPVTAQLVGVIENHDRTRFEAIGISFGSDDRSEMCLRLTSAFERFAFVENHSDFDVASFLRGQEVDIAVDLMGHTGGSRPGIFAFRPAPIQVNFLGFPGTTGADYIDYIIADDVVIPQRDQTYYSERVVHLPDSYFPTDANRRIADRTPSRGEAGLPEAAFVFCSFNNSFKYSPEMFGVWMRLLREKEGSVLWLPQANDEALGNLRREAAARGVEATRLVFAPFVPNPADHLARLRLADLFLDTLPYNAHSSACDALWAGVPIVTCGGATFAGRVASSVLTAIGLPELIASSLDRYEALALHLARNPEELAGLRAKLASNRTSHALFDTRRFTRHLEAAYQRILERSHDGLLPQHVAVPVSLD